jgi:excisionase family DNA binding protein
MRALGAIGIHVDRDTDEDPDHTRYSWALVGPNDSDPPDRIELLLRAIHQRRRWRAQYDRARSATDDHDSGEGGVNRYLTVSEAAHLNTSERFIRRLAERRIAFHPVGRHVRITLVDLDAFVAADRVEPVRGGVA